MAGVRAWPVLLAACLIGAPSYAQYGSGDVPTGGSSPASHEVVDMELLEFMADWLGDDGEWINPESFDSEEDSEEESYEN